MHDGSMARREIPPWVVIIVILIVLGAAAWFYRGLYLPPPGPDVFALDPRNPNNVALFRQMDEYYKKHPNEKPSNWPPPQFTEDAIARAQEQHRQEFAEAEQKRAKVIEEYLRQTKPGR